MPEWRDDSRQRGCRQRPSGCRGGRRFREWPRQPQRGHSRQHAHQQRDCQRARGWRIGSPRLRQHNDERVDDKRPPSRRIGRHADRQPAPGRRGGGRGQGWLRARQHPVGIQRPRHLRRTRLRKRGSALFALRVPGQWRFVRRLLGVREQRSAGRRPVLHAGSRRCPCAVQQRGDGRGRGSQLLGKRCRTAASARRRFGIDSGVEYVERIERDLPAVPHLHAGKFARQRVVRSFRRRHVVVAAQHQSDAELDGRSRDERGLGRPRRGAAFG